MILSRFAARAIVGAVTVGVAGSPCSAVEAWYTVQVLPLPPGAVGLRASGLSDTGEVVGVAEFPAGSQGFSVQGQSLRLLAAPDEHFGSWPVAVNRHGTIVGGTVDEFGIPKAAVWASADDGAPALLESSGGSDANVYVTGINDSGAICGYYTGSGSGNVSSWRAVKWVVDGDRLRQRVLITGVSPLPPGVFHAAYGINESEVVVGTGAWDDPTLLTMQAAIRWNAGEQASELAVLAGVDAVPRFEALAVNDEGAAVGVLIRNDGRTLGVLWSSDGTVTDLGLPAGYTISSAVGINNSGVIVGSLGSGEASVAAVHFGAGWVDLRSQIVGGFDAPVASAVAINASGQIVAHTVSGGVTRAILLTPAAAPGDVDGDGDTDLADLARLLSTFGLCEGDAGFDAATDLDSNGCVDLGDLAALLAAFGT